MGNAGTYLSWRKRFPRRFSFFWFSSRVSSRPRFWFCLLIKKKDKKESVSSVCAISLQSAGRVGWEIEPNSVTVCVYKDVPSQASYASCSARMCFFNKSTSSFARKVSVLYGQTVGGIWEMQYVPLAKRSFPVCGLVLCPNPWLVP